MCARNCGRRKTCYYVGEPSRSNRIVYTRVDNYYDNDDEDGIIIMKSDDDEAIRLYYEFDDDD